MSGIRLENGNLSVLVDPERGGKMTSVFVPRKDFELLYQPRGEYPPLRPGMPFSDGDASGFDDVFPSMGECWTDPDTGCEILLPDHGEIWTARMKVDAVREDAVDMHTFGQCFPYRYDKSIQLRGNRVLERIRVTNRGTGAFPCLWVCHCLMKPEEGMTFAFPAGSERIEWIPCGSWQPDGGIPVLIRDFQIPPAGEMMKFYFREPVQTGACSVRYPRSGVQATLHFHPEQLPYLGFWMTNGGYRGEVNFAFEPASGYFDILRKASETGTLPMLRPGEHSVYEVEIALEDGN